MSRFEIVTIESLNVYRDPASPSCGWLRDSEIAERAQMANSRDVRTHIKKLIDEGSFLREDIGVAGGDANRGALYRIEQDVVTSGRGRTQTVDVYYLNEEAALLLIMRLRTPVAVELQKRVVRVFLAFARGELVAAPPVIATPAPSTRPLVGDKLDRLLAEVDRLEAEQAYDRETARAHRLRLIQQYEGVDLATAPAPIAIGRVTALPLLAEGAIVIPRVETAGTKTATDIGKPLGLSARDVGAVADQLGIRQSILSGDTTHGVRDRPSFGNGRTGDWQARYNDAAIEKMSESLRGIVAAKLAKKAATAQRKAGKQANGNGVAFPQSGGTAE